jgi:sirohydrochlorin ferrochelatase
MPRRLEFELVIVASHSGVAAVLASHGDRAGIERNRVLASHTESVRRLAGLPAVMAGVLKGEPSLEAALGEAAAAGAHTILVYPLFMAEGYFATTVLPDRIRAAGFESSTRILPPLGIDPGVVDLMRADALEASRKAGFAPQASRLLVVGHGSKFGPASAQATRVAADRIARGGIFASVATAFLEEPPFLRAELECVETPTIVAGFFYGDGMHAGDDVPAAIEETGARAVYAGPVGYSTGIPSLIASSLIAATRADAR